MVKIIYTLLNHSHLFYAHKMHKIIDNIYLYKLYE